MNSKRHAVKEKQSESATIRGTRGATMSKEVTKAITSGVKFQVEWDDDGQAIGPHAAELKSYIGTTVKRLVAITFSDWRNVPQTLKDMVWKEVLMAFILPQQKKSWLLKVANTLWRRFKSDLTTHHMFDEDEDLRLSPPEMYTQYINQDQWNRFISTRQSEEFKESSEAHRQLSLKNKYSYRGSRLGYAGISAKMKRELGTSNISRADVWKKARLQKDGQFAPEVQELVNIMENLSEQASLGEIQISERQDILSLALDKEEHPRRIRGVGQYVTMREYYGRASRNPSMSDAAIARAVKEIEEKMGEKLKEMQERHTNSQAEIMEMQGFIVKLLQEVSKELPHLSIPIPQFGSRIPRVPVAPNVDPSSIPPDTTVNSNEDSVQSIKETQTKLIKGRVKINESTIHLSSKMGSPTVQPSCAPPSASCNSLNEEFVPCTLFWPNMGQQVAKGSVCRSTSGVKLHHRALDPGSFKVQVITPIPGKGEVGLPRPTDEAQTVFQAIGGFVAWPIELVSTTKDLEKPRKEAPKIAVNPIVATNESIIHLSSRRDMVESYTNRMPNFFWYHRAMGNTIRNIKLSNVIMGYEHTISVGKIDVGQLLDGKEITATHTSFYIKYLWDTHCHNVDHMYGFLCPSSVSPGESRKTLTDRQQYIVNSIRGDIEMKMVLAPYNFGSHWVLLAINVKDDTVYYLDHFEERFLWMSRFSLTRA